MKLKQRKIDVSNELVHNDRVFRYAFYFLAKKKNTLA